MSWLVDFVKSSIGAKVVMGVTGVMLIGFVIMHMVGNLQVFLGPETLNAYGKMLHDLGGLLWVARFGLIGAVVLHIASGLRLASLNKAARPVRYVHETTVQASFASRYMKMSGIVVLAFVVYHLLHFTLGGATPDHTGLTTQLADGTEVKDIYKMVVLGFQQPAVSAAYIIAMVLLGLHLNHGATSLFQSLGLRNAKYNTLIDKVGPALSIFVVVGNCSMPIAILTGAVGLVGGH
ncbi:MAG: succinate dehydrogenase cytochrome b subunit [Deltaproteobacteria bacterium]|jgi:succinate dehydrogenase / fumarate reductase, cytochrome b subunit|nr:succinate dehydrogenase cytochrome b subunit [Deltaproteobacteria bacterium]MBT6436238.1 succinate dehydrogenase cytochrome b subunit [Deltaproteobacteria bacterium]